MMRKVRLQMTMLASVASVRVSLLMRLHAQGLKQGLELEMELELSSYLELQRTFRWQ